MTVFAAGCGKSGKNGANEKFKTIEDGKLKVGINLHEMPMSYLNEETVKPMGFEVEIAQNLAENLGLSLEIVDTTETNLLKSLDADIYDCVISTVGLNPWNQTEYAASIAYADVKSVKDMIDKEIEDTKIAVFTKKGNTLIEAVDKELESMIKSGKVKAISEKYFEKDITVKETKKRNK